MRIFVAAARAMDRYYPIIVVGLLMLLHLPFLSADPDTQVSPMSRGAWTDEGLNTVQVRNFVNHGQLSMDECDNLIKTPYFGFVLVPFYSLLGTHPVVGRLLVLSCVLMVLFLFLRHAETRRFATVLAIIGLLQFHVFHYSHYSLAEMLAISWIMLGIYLLWRSADGRHWLWSAAATACFSLAYYSKVTFAYAVFIPFMVRYLQFLSDRMDERFHTRPLLADWGIQSAVTGFFATAFYFKWYLPNQAVFALVKQNQGTGRYDLSEAWDRFTFNLDHFIMVDGMAPYYYLLPVAVIGLLLARRAENRKKILVFGMMSWLLLETHHVLLVNPPTRYVLPLFFVSLAVVSLALSEMSSDGMRRILLWSVLMLAGGYNLSNYWQSLHRRTHSIAEVRTYLNGHDLEDETVLGVWGATLASNTGVYVIPVWNDFTMDADILETQRPRIVFSEHDEAESGQFFSSHDTDLKARADSMRTFDLWRYSVDLYWIGTGK